MKFIYWFIAIIAIFCWMVSESFLAALLVAMALSFVVTLLHAMFRKRV